MSEIYDILGKDALTILCTNHLSKNICPYGRMA